MRCPPALLIAALSAVDLHAHAGQTIEIHDLWLGWSFEPGVTVPLVITACLYLRGARPARGVTRRQSVCFWAGWGSLAAALISPLHTLGEALFSAHMAQHEVLMLVAAPLLVLSRPLVPMLWGLPLQWRRTAGQSAKTPLAQRFWRGLTCPFTAWWIHAVALWIWHAPVLFQATLSSELVHALQHASFLFSALLFWWSLFYARGRAAYGLGVLYIFTTAVHTSILGALLTFARTVWYPAYGSRAVVWGLTPLEDQQVGGLLMWVPAGVVYLVAGLALFGAWLQGSGLATDRRSFADSSLHASIR